MDWCFVEAVGPHPAAAAAYSDAPPASMLERLQAASPIAHVEAVTAPCLFLLGEKDRRVPMSNGLQFMHALRAAGKAPAEVIVFPEDGHALDRPQTEFESILSILSWFRTHAS